MAFVTRGAILISTSKKEHYSRGQKIINALVNLAPGLLGRFTQQPTITIHESFDQDGVPLSEPEILKQKRSMVEDAIREMDYPIPSWRETTAEIGDLKRVTITYGAKGVEKTSEEPFDFVAEKIQSIVSISPATKDSLMLAGVDLNVLVGVIKSSEKPAMFANRIERLVRLVDDFNMPKDLEDILTQKIKSVIQDSLLKKSISENFHRHYSMRQEDSTPDIACTIDLSTLPNWRRADAMEMVTQETRLTTAQKIDLIGSNIERQKRDLADKGIVLPPVTKIIFSQWDERYQDLRQNLNTETCDRFLQCGQALLDIGNLPNYLDITCDANMSLIRGIKVEISKQHKISKHNEDTGIFTDINTESETASSTLCSDSFSSAVDGATDKSNSPAPNEPTQFPSPHKNHREPN